MDALNCTKCQLHTTRTNVVLGSGPSDAKIVLIGEAPGEEEDLNGIPFIGKAGTLLRNTMRLSGIDPDKVFITNSILCRPPNNRNPTKDELCSCRHWLKNKLMEINPKLIVSIGKFATATLLNQDPNKIKITYLVGKPIEFPIFGKDSFLIIPTLHPSYILRGGKEREVEYLLEFSFIYIIAKQLGLLE